MNIEKSTVQELFSSKPVHDIECQILTLVCDAFNNSYRYSYNKKAIQELLKVRKRLLDSQFVMDLHYKALLCEFNEALKCHLLRMRERTIKMYDVIKDSNDGNCNLTAIGKCFLGYEYSILHPVQTIRARKMWEVLNNTIDSYMPLYDSGVGISMTLGKESQPDSSNQLLWLSEEESNWNEGLEPELTADMNLVYAFHSLWANLDFSIFDLLWVRDFNIEISLEEDYSTLPHGSASEELDWSKADFFD